MLVGLPAGLPDAELLAMLTAVRGIGPWTVDMFAMFHLGRPDVLPTGDLGVRKVQPQGQAAAAGCLCGASSADRLQLQLSLPVLR